MRVQQVLFICIFRVCILNKLDKTFLDMRITWTYGIIGENFSLPFAPFFPLLIYISAIFPDWGKIDFNTMRPFIIWYHIFISRSVRKANAILKWKLCNYVSWCLIDFVFTYVLRTLIYLFLLSYCLLSC